MSFCAVDAFGYNGGKTLFAVDDMKWPKYAYFYDISGAPKVVTFDNIYNPKELTLEMQKKRKENFAAERHQ